MEESINVSFRAIGRILYLASDISRSVGYGAKLNDSGSNQSQVLLAWWDSIWVHSAFPCRSKRPQFDSKRRRRNNGIQFAEEIPGMNPRVFRLERDKRAKAAGPRTTLHIYCSLEDARNIRRAARLGQVTISGFVLHCLWHSWQIEDSLAEIQREMRIHRDSLWTVPN